MCWSGEASALLATVGLATTIHMARRQQAPALWITLGYFALMELLQAFTYPVIDQCALPSNQIATLLGYLHIAFQPFFINAISMHFLPEEWQKKIRLPAYAVCFVTAMVMVMQLMPLEWAGRCRLGEPLCAHALCSVSGNWHIAWNVPLNGLGLIFNWAGTPYQVPLYLLAYGVAGFLMPLVYGVWRGTVFHLFLGPTLAWLTTDNMNEWPAVWCLLSIGIIMLVIKARSTPGLQKRRLGAKTQARAPEPGGPPLGQIPKGAARKASQ